MPIHWRGGDKEKGRQGERILLLPVSLSPCLLVFLPRLLVFRRAVQAASYSARTGGSRPRGTGPFGRSGAGSPRVRFVAAVWGRALPVARASATGARRACRG